MQSGFFCIDKSAAMTSHNVISRMRKILDMKKVGHSGTLDPMATGVLIVGCGTSTRLLDYVQSGIKEYVAEISFGTKTTTGDFEGTVVDKTDMSNLSLNQLEAVIPKFVGEIEQTPPMVSAIKIDGKKLYEYEREGIEIERKKRKVTIHSLDVTDFQSSNNEVKATIIVNVSAGTYIRTLAEDIAESLGGYAHLTKLRRTKNGTITESDLISLDELEQLPDPFLKMVSPAQALEHLAQISLDEKQTKAVSFGQRLELNDIQKQSLKHSQESVFLAKGDSPRELVAIYPSGDLENLKSKCIVFLD